MSSQVLLLRTQQPTFQLSAYKAVSIASTLSTRKGIESTFDTYLKSFTQIRFQIWNPILLFFCLGTIANFLCYLIHSLLAPFSTSRSKVAFTNPVLGGFNPRRNKSMCLVSYVYFSTKYKAVLQGRGFKPRSF